MTICASICVYCGSNSGTAPIFQKEAEKFGRMLALSGRTVIYGGARVGLMGALARGALAEKGRVIGVIPRALLEKELAMDGLSELHIVKNMHLRKEMMADLAEGFVALPGGIGTLEEFAEIWTWGQLGFHEKPIGFLNIQGFYDGLLTFLDHQSEMGFVKPALREMALCDSDGRTLLTKLDNYVPQMVPKWSEGNFS